MLSVLWVCAGVCRTGSCILTQRNVCLCMLVVCVFRAYCVLLVCAAQCRARSRRQVCVLGVCAYVLCVLCVACVYVMCVLCVACVFEFWRCARTTQQILMQVSSLPVSYMLVCVCVCVCVHVCVHVCVLVHMCVHECNVCASMPDLTEVMCTCPCCHA